MTREGETPLETARRYVAQEAKIEQQRLLIRQIDASGQSTVNAERDLAWMKRSLSLLLGRVSRLGELGSGSLT